MNDATLTEIVEIAGRLERSDPKKFHQIWAWIETQKRQFTNEAILASLKEVRKHSGDIRNSWSYMTTVLERIRDRTAQAEIRARKNVERNSGIDPELRDFVGLIGKPIQ